MRVKTGIWPGSVLIGLAAAVVIAVPASAAELARASFRGPQVKRGWTRLRQRQHRWHQHDRSV